MQSTDLYPNKFDILDPRTDKILILDLDETLLSTQEDMSEFKIVRNSSDIKLKDQLYELKFADGSLWGMRRPGLDDFLRFSFEYFSKVVVWTAGEPEYASKVCKAIFSLKKPVVIWAKNKVEFPDGLPLKNLNKICEYYNWDISKCVTIDDSPYASRMNQERTIFIPEYKFDVKTEYFEDPWNALDVIVDWLIQNEELKDLADGDPWNINFATRDMKKSWPKLVEKYRLDREKAAEVKMSKES